MRSCHRTSVHPRAACTARSMTFEGQETVDIAEVAARMAESLVDLVLRAPEEQQAQLLAATIGYVGQAFLEKTGAIAGDGNTVQ